jgi:hypothetical protein
LKKFKNDSKLVELNKERLDPFSILEEDMEVHKEPIGQPSCTLPLNFVIDENVKPGCMPSCGTALGDDRTITFDEFFEVMVRKITEERRYSDNIIFESSTVLH